MTAPRGVLPPGVARRAFLRVRRRIQANKRVQFGYGLNYLIDIENAVIIDVEATLARAYDEPLMC
jgi:hypothetical protein